MDPPLRRRRIQFSGNTSNPPTLRWSSPRWPETKKNLTKKQKRQRASCVDSTIGSNYECAVLVYISDISFCGLHTIITTNIREIRQGAGGNSRIHRIVGGNREDSRRSGESLRKVSYYSPLSVQVVVGEVRFPSFRNMHLQNTPPPTPGEQGDAKKLLRDLKSCELDLLKGEIQCKLTEKLQLMRAIYPIFLPNHKLPRYIAQPTSIQRYGRRPCAIHRPGASKIDMWLSNRNPLRILIQILSRRVRVTDVIRAVRT